MFIFQEKCFQYFPKRNGNSLKFGSVIVQVINIDSEIDDLEIRSIHITRVFSFVELFKEIFFLLFLRITINITLLTIILPVGQISASLNHEGYLFSLIRSITKKTVDPIHTKEIEMKHHRQLLFIAGSLNLNESKRSFVFHLCS